MLHVTFEGVRVDAIGRHTIRGFYAFNQCEAAAFCRQDGLQFHRKTPEDCGTISI
jgi:hypothetical protein